MPDYRRAPSINEANAVSFLARHLVSLSIIAPKVDQERQVTSGRQIYGYSGFVIEFLGEWFFLTAGHVLNEIRDTLRAWPNGEVRVFLLDSFGIDATTDLPVQIDFEPPAYCQARSRLPFGFLHRLQNALNCKPAR
jgi:hypothetical protein